MDKAKAMELANKMLNLDKNDVKFFDFINEQFQDDNVAISFIEQIDKMLEQNYSAEMANIKYIVVSLIKDNNKKERIYKSVRRINRRKKRASSRESSK